jgi:hypothetical protein
MPRPRTDPPTTDFTQKFHILDLHRWGYLQPGNWTFKITFRNPYTGEPTGQIATELAMTETGGWLRLRYSVKAVPYDYLIQIEAVTSNLGRGVYYLFRCPLSGQRTPYFAHRAALGVKYETQYVAGPFGAVLPYFKRHCRAIKELEKPQRKKEYAGKPTRWYLAALKALGKNRELAPSLLTAIRSR